MKKIYKKIGVFLLLIGFLAISLIPIKSVNATTYGYKTEFNTWTNNDYYDYAIYSFPVDSYSGISSFISNEWNWNISSQRVNGTSANVYNITIYITRTERSVQNPRTETSEILSITTQNGILHIYGFAIVFRGYGFKVFAIYQNEGTTTLGFTTTEIYNYSSSLNNNLCNRTITSESVLSINHYLSSPNDSVISNTINNWLCYNQASMYIFYNGLHNAYTQAQLEQEYQNNLTKWVRTIFTSFNSFFDIKIGSVSLGAIILIPLSISVTWFIIKNIRGGGA